MEEGGSNRTQEAYAPGSNKETCANPLSNPAGDSFSKRLPFLQVKGNGLLLTPFTRRVFVYTGIQDGHKDDTSSRSRRTRTRWIISLGDREIGIAEGIHLLHDRQQ